MMKAVQVSRRGGPLELVEREVPEPAEGQVRIRVEACGVCHGEMVAIDGHHPLASYPRVPGHEVIGTIDKLGARVDGWRVGQRVGVGWSGGHEAVTGLTYDGGYAEFMAAPVGGLVRIPDGLDPVAAAPLMCAGVTTFDALRNGGARPGDVVAIQGIGGLGHLALQYARKAGYRTVAISRGPQKKALSLELGAHAYVDAAAEDAAAALQALGGAKVILATAPNAKAIAALVDGLARNGALICVAGDGAPMQVSPLQLLVARRSIKGWVAEGAKDIDDTVRFSVLAGVRATTEVFPLAQAPEALARMLKADVRFRAVLKMV